MRRVYVSADIEGVCGIADWKETELDGEQGARFRDQMTREVAAACAEAAEGGADEILVKDAHGSGRSIDGGLLPRQARLMRSWTRDPWCMMAGLERGFYGAMFIGYHAAAGTGGNPLAHTMDLCVQEMRINGELASEFTVNAYTAAFLGVPALLVSGDRALCESARRVAPNIRAVEVSQGLGGATVALHPALAVERIAAAAADAMDADPASMAVPLPGRFALSVSYREHARAYRASFYPGARAVGPCETAFESGDWPAVLAFIHFAL